MLHLRDAYAVLEKRIAKDGRAGWIAEEMAALVDPETYALRPEDAWRRLKVRSARESSSPA